MSPLAPIYTSHLFPALHEELMALLRGLDQGAWRAPTVCGSWQVRDIAAHILDGYVRRVWSGQPSPSHVDLSDYRQLVGYLNRLNADWVDAMRRVSPQLLIEFLAIAGPLSAAVLAARDPALPAPISVAWAGEERSLNWFDVGREYTEQWHHQQQIRDAVGAPALTARKWLQPVLSLFVRALPRAYRSIEADADEAVNIAIDGEAGGEWALAREGRDWVLYEGRHPAPAAQVRLAQDTAWRLFTNQLDLARAVARLEIEGRRELGEALATVRAVMV